MATRVGIRELRDNLTSLLRRVREQGETIEVTHHGRPIAVIGPPADDWEARLIASGELTPATRSLRDLPPPRPWTGDGKTPFEILMEERESYD